MRIYESPHEQPCSQYVPDHFLPEDTEYDGVRFDACTERYFDVPPPANDATRVYRKARRSQPYDGICSTRFRYGYVSLPRVSLLDGAYRNQANDNHAQEASHAPATCCRLTQK